MVHQTIFSYAWQHKPFLWKCRNGFLTPVLCMGEDNAGIFHKTALAILGILAIPDVIRTILWYDTEQEICRNGYAYFK